MTTTPISNVTRRVQFTGNAITGPFAFTFNILADSDLIVIKNTSPLDLSVDYTVSTNSNGTGSITLGSALSATDILTIIGGRSLERTTDFVTAGDLLASSLNEQLDSLVIMAQQLDEKVGRAITVNAGDETVSLEMPTKDNRKGTVLAFNATTGVPEAGPTIADVSTVAAITADISTLADIEDGTTATDAISGVAAIKTNVTTVAGVASSVSALAATDVLADMAALNTTAVLADMAALGESAVIANMAQLGTASVVSNMAQLGTSSVVADIATLADIEDGTDATDAIQTVAGVSTAVAALGPISANITAVANDATDIGNVAGAISNINLVASNINSGVLTAINDFGSVANAAVSTNDYGSL